MFSLSEFVNASRLGTQPSPACRLLPSRRMRQSSTRERLMAHAFNSLSTGYAELDIARGPEVQFEET